MRSSYFVLALAIATPGCKSGDSVKQTADASADNVGNWLPDLASGTADMRGLTDDVAASRSDVPADSPSQAGPDVPFDASATKDSSAVPRDAGRDQTPSPDLAADAAKADGSSDIGREVGTGGARG